MINKTIIITGASKGIGLAIAEKFYAEGWSLALCARNIDSFKNKFKETDTQKVLVLSCDVSVKAQVIAFADEVLKTFKTIDALVNNAGKFIPGAVHEEEDGTLEMLIETNLYSAYNLSRKLIPQMKLQGNGSIFNICSIASTHAYPNGGSYSISKFALHGFSKALREELKPHNIKVTALLPGATLTDSWSSSSLPESRFIKSSDIADLVFSIYNLSANTVIEDVVLRPVLGDI